MKKWFVFVGLILIVAIAIYWLAKVQPASSMNASENRAESASTAIKQKSDLQKIENSNSEESKNNETAIHEYVEHTLQDIHWDWKQPINFWGRVVDENNTSIANADIHFEWNVIGSEQFPTGTDVADIKSDANGFFSLTNQRGKGLSVNVAKDGYYKTTSARQSFEYANPAADDFFKPDPNNPVVFHLRKKGEAEPMKHWSKEINIAIGQAASLQLDQETILQVTLLTNAPLSEKQWAARINVSGGGVQFALDEFPFLAPTDGYVAELELDLESPKPSTWMTLYQGGQFYVKTAMGYGRIELRTIAGKSFLQATVYLNPSGSRNLEFDPVKEIRTSQ